MKKFMIGALFEKKSYYTRMFLIYTVFTIAVIMIFSMIITNRLNIILSNEINKSNQRLLTQIQIYSDTYLLNKVKYIILENFLLNTNDKKINNFFNPNASEGMSEIINYKTNLNDIIISNNYIESIQLYRATDDTLLSSRAGIVTSFLFRKDMNGQYVDVDLIEKAISSEEGEFLVNPAENRGFWSEEFIISFVYTTPLFAPHGQRNGCVIINIDQEIFFEFIRRISPSRDKYNGELMIMDSKGRLFAHSDENRLYADHTDYRYITDHFEDADHFISTAVNGNPVAITWVESSINDWKYISVMPVEVLNRELWYARRIAGIILLVVILFSIAGIRFITQFLYKPLKALFNSALEKRNIGAGGGNELMVIRNVMEDMSGKIKEMENYVKENHSLIRYKTVMELLNATVHSEIELKERLLLTGIRFVHGKFLLLLTEINEREFMGFPADNREFITYKAMELIDGCFASDQAESLSINHPSHCIITIVNYETCGMADHFDNLMEALKNILNIKINIFVGNPLSSILSLHEKYKMMSGFLRYGFIYGYDHVFTEELVSRFERKTPDLTTDMLSRMEAHLRSNRIHAFKEEITGIAASIKKDGYSYDFAHNFLLHILGLISRINLEQNLNAYELSKEDLMNTFYAMSSLDECIVWIHGILDIYENTVNLRNSSISLGFIDSIASYVVDNTDKQLSLNLVADRFHITPNYLSRVFKETTGVNFSDFLIEKKLEKASELLKTCNPKEISQIAESIGYVTPAYFSRLFKEKYGFTPAQYRKKHM